MAEFLVSELRIGRVRPLGASSVPSGIFKDRATGPVDVTPCGFEGDEQADRRHHGGPDKAIHAYPAAHYRDWQRDLPDRAEQFRPGAFGENLVVEHAAEADICLGDRWKLGKALLQVSQSRQPCWRLNLRFDRGDMARRVQDSGRTGWYFRVLEPGRIAAGQMARLVDRPHPDWSLDKVWDLLYLDRDNREALTAFAALPGLPERWRSMAEARLVTGRSEDWTGRLETPA